MSSRSHGSSSQRHQGRGERKERERSRDRERLRKSSNHEQTDGAKKMVDLKAKIREGLAQATTLSQIRGETIASTSTTIIKEEVNDRSSLSRLRQIEAIAAEEGGFRQQHFKSTAGGAGGRVYGNKKQQLSRIEKAIKKEDAHEESIFGPTKPQTLDDISLPKDPTKEGNGMKILLHPSLSEDPEVRKERWLKIWTQRRREFGIG
ncbi:unnamed protein product, partial [Mesorhabditis belari]|uniref:Uncharacterized protein n=1 Tax=Mesorhabditis belari TaxID=2138241 RepID=A0AAF3EWI7_9BILA